MHPQLNQLTPYDLGGDYDPNGAWQGGWMELVEGAETMALDGGHGSRDGRPPMCGITPVDEQRIYYYVLWPNAFLSIHPDYLLVHRLVPLGPAARPVICDWLFEAETIAMAGFDPDGGDRVLGPHQPPGLARLRAPAARDARRGAGSPAATRTSSRRCRRST